MPRERMRCPWPGNDPLMITYHDEDWGVPVHDDRKLFEFLVLDAAQAGLSWSTILKKREGYRRAFDGFDARRVAGYGEAEIAARMSDPAIVRNRRKIESAIVNARALLDVRKEFGTFDAYIWSFTGGRTKRNAWKSIREIPVTTDESVAMSRDLVHRGFRFVGPTICYSFMQAAGMVNDHLVTCFRYRASVRR